MSASGVCFSPAFTSVFTTVLITDFTTGGGRAGVYASGVCGSPAPSR